MASPVQNSISLGLIFMPTYQIIGGLNNMTEDPANLTTYKARSYIYIYFCARLAEK